MNELFKLKELYRLKEVNRKGIVNDRWESTAEHIYSSQILAKYFIRKIKIKLDEQKVMLMLLYHDLPEIICGDTNIFDKKLMKTKDERERNALAQIEFPEKMSEEIIQIWTEYQNNKTKEAKFCQAIDKLDPVIQFVGHKDKWHEAKLTEEKLRSYKDKYFELFPEIMTFWNELINHVKEKGYFID